MGDQWGQHQFQPQHGGQYPQMGFHFDQPVAAPPCMTPPPFLSHGPSMSPVVTFHPEMTRASYYPGTPQPYAANNYGGIQPYPQSGYNLGQPAVAPATMSGVVTVQPSLAQGQYNPPGVPQPSTAGYSGGAPPNVPQGLECLATLDQVLVQQKVELLEAITGFETENQYEILDVHGQEIFRAKEDTDCCTRQCCGKTRPFNMKMKDGNGQEIIHLTRPLACSSCWCPCCLQSIKVESPPGNLIGRVQQNWSLCMSEYDVKDETGKAVYFIKGPCCTFSCCFGDVEFDIYPAGDHGMGVGKISMKWSGLAKEAFTDADNFGISFPAVADAKMKATLLGACMLIDYMFFEDTGEGNNKVRRAVI